MTTAPARIAAPENGLGTAALIVGILAAVICAVPVLGLLGAPLALIGLGLSIPGLMRANAGRATNRGSAIAGLVLSILALLACLLWVVVGVVAASDSSPQTGTTNSSAEDVTAAKDQPAGADVSSSDKTVAVGKAVVIDDFGGRGRASVTVTDVKSSVTSTNEFVTPDAGNKHVAARVTIKNVGKETYENVSWFGAKVYTAQGQAYDADPLGEAALDEALPMKIDLKPGGTVAGWILFEIPAKGEVSSVVFDDAEWGL